MYSSKPRLRYLLGCACGAAALVATGATWAVTPLHARSSDDPSLSTRPTPEPAESPVTDSPDTHLPGAHSPAQKRDAGTQVIQVAYTPSAFGTDAGVIGAAGFSSARGDLAAGQPAQFGGGLRIWGSPLERLAFQVDGERRDDGTAAPSASVFVRLLGTHDGSWALAALAKYKAEGFAEVEGEIELGLANSWQRSGWNFDLGAIAGAGFEEEEVDGELLARLRYAIAEYLSLGAEGRGRYRLRGSAPLPGGRDWDAFGGAQVCAQSTHFFGAFTFGPSTIGIERGVGWQGMLTAGGVSF